MSMSVPALGGPAATPLPPATTPLPPAATPLPIEIFRLKPSYYMSSVDKSLLLIQTLRDFGPIKLTEAARAIGASPSATHRILSMLVYRGFAVQDDDRTYAAGPAIGAYPLGATADVREILQSALPKMEQLAERESALVSFAVLAGTDIRFLNVVGDWALRKGDNKGAVLPAAKTVTGRAALATLSIDVLEKMYRDPEASWNYMSSETFTELVESLAVVRRTGYAVMNHTGDSRMALGMALVDGFGTCRGALALTFPSPPRRTPLEPRIAALRGLVDALGRQLP